MANLHSLGPGRASRGEAVQVIANPVRGRERTDERDEVSLQFRVC